MPAGSVPRPHGRARQISPCREARWLILHIDKTYRNTDIVLYSMLAISLNYVPLMREKLEATECFFLRHDTFFLRHDGIQSRRFWFSVSDGFIRNEKSAQRDANTARALAVVRFGHRPPATNTQTHRQDRLQYTVSLASAQCNNWTRPGLRDVEDNFQRAGVYTSPIYSLNTLAFLREGRGVMSP